MPRGPRILLQLSSIQCHPFSHICPAGILCINMLAVVDVQKHYMKRMNSHMMKCQEDSMPSTSLM